jgi:classical protein kinase C
MLHQLDYKLTLEKQFREGIDKMLKLYQVRPLMNTLVDSSPIAAQVDGDRKSRQDAESKRIESAQKMQLLTQAMKRYKSLDIMGDMEDEEDSACRHAACLRLLTSHAAGDDIKPNQRRPLSGALNISILQARDLNRPPFANKRGKSRPESVVVVKVEDTPRARTHPSRTDRWNEDFEIHVDKANEVEVTIYDKSAGDLPVPIGMLWIRISDVVEALRRKKAGNDSGPGWVTAGRVSSANAAAGGGTSALDVPMGRQLPPPPSAQPGFGSTASEGIEAWFAVEPEGAIQLNLNFGASAARKCTARRLTIAQSSLTSASDRTMAPVSVDRAPSASVRRKCTSKTATSSSSSSFTPSSSAPSAANTS